MPNIKSIRAASREEDEIGREKIKLEFEAVSHIPAIARPLFKPDMLRWTEYVVCDPVALTMEWIVETRVFRDFVDCGGISRITDSEDGTSLVEVNGHISLSPAPMPGVPPALVRSAVKAVEPFIGRLVEPNVAKFYRALRKMMIEGSCQLTFKVDG